MYSFRPVPPFAPARLAQWLAFALFANSAASALAGETYAPWLRQIGINTTIESAANWGKGQLLGVVDTGISASNQQFSAGQLVLSRSGCAAISFKCSNGYNDDNGHGTAVASIAAGSRTLPYSSITASGYTTVLGNQTGVAPLANILSQKVLNASGSGFSLDVANGIRKAADGGAGVINVSITYQNSADIVSAINYAASKGAFIVWAGGNSSANLVGGANTSGLTQSAIDHLVFAGSVNSNNALSSFSNRPGSGKEVSTSGTSSSYASRWIMAPGEGILASYIQGGNAAYGYWSGTSMSAPIVSGSLMLLQNAWPILKTKGTTVNLLLATATDLGTKGVDATYGNGLVNLQTAFSPYGALSITKTNGQSVPLTSVTGSLITSGALGDLSSVRAQLANYTVFDTYARNFSVNLSSLVDTSKVGKATLNPLPSNTRSGPTIMKFSGGELAYSWQNSQSTGQSQGAEPLHGERKASYGYALYTNRSGDITGMSYGAYAAYPFARAMFNDHQLALASEDFNQGSIGGLTTNGYQFTYGTALTKDLRMALAYSRTAHDDVAMTDGAQNNQIKLGLHYQLTPSFGTSISYTHLSERQSLMGAYSSGDNILSLGDNHTNVIGVNLSYRLNANSSLLLSGDFASTRAHSNDFSSLFSETSRLQSRAFGMSYLHQDLIKPKDELTLSIKQPLRISSGSAALQTVSVDGNGYPVYEKHWASLVPEGREMDYSVSYSMPTSKVSRLALQAVYKKDAQNLLNNDRASIGLLWNGRF